MTTSARTMGLKTYAFAWGLLLIALVLPANVPALQIWGHHTLFFPIAVALLGVALLAVERQGAWSWPPGLRAVYLLLAVVLLWIVVSAWVWREAHPPVLGRLVAADAVRIVFVVCGIETLRRMDSPARRIFVMLVPLVVLLALAGILGFRDVGISARVFDSLHERMERLYTGVGDPNFTALALNVALGGALGFAITARRVGLRLFALAAALILVGALATTLSLGGLVGFLFLLGALVLGSAALGFDRRSRRRVLWIAAAAVLILAGLGGGLFWARIVSEWQRTVANPLDFGAYRLGLLIGGARMLLAHPWWGAGPGRVYALMPRFVPATSVHNTYLQTCHDFLVGLGDESGMIPMLVVTILLGCLVVAFWRRLWPRWRGRDGYPSDPWGMIVFATLGATIVQALALPAQRDPYLWLIVVVAAAHLLSTRATTSEHVEASVSSSRDPQGNRGR